MSAKNEVIWVCKHCGKKNEWMWESDDFELVKVGTVHMCCNKCEKITKVRYLKNGCFVSVDT